MRLAQFEDFGAVDFGTFDAGALDFGSLDMGALDFGADVPLDFGMTDVPLDFGVTTDTGIFDPVPIETPSDWMNDPSIMDPNYQGEFTSDPFADSNFGLDPWTETMNVDTGNIGLDVPEASVAEVAQESGASIADVTNTALQFPDVSMSDVFSYLKQGLTLYKAFQTAQTNPLTPRQPGMVYDPRTGRYVPATGTTATTTQRRTVTDPATGKQITVQWNPTTGKWERVPSEWIAGVPNWAIIAGGAAAALLLLGGKRRKA